MFEIISLQKGGSKVTYIPIHPAFHGFMSRVGILGPPNSPSDPAPRIIPVNIGWTFAAIVV